MTAYCEPLTESPPQWVIDELREWFKSGRSGSFTIHTVNGEPMKIEETAYKKPPIDKHTP